MAPRSDEGTNRMGEVEDIRKHAQDLLNNPSKGPDTILQASQLLRNAEEIEHRRAQIKQLSKDLPESRLLQYLNLLVPIVTVLILVATLLFQERDKAADQAQAQQDKTENRENEQWDRAVRASADKDENDRTAAIVLLRGIEESPSRYKGQASKLVISILRAAKSFDDFQTLFSAEFAPPGQENLDRILNVDRAIHQEWVNKKKVNARFDGSDCEHLVIQELGFICTQVHPLLQKRPSDKFFDLGFVAFFDCNLTDVDLTRADLTGFTTARVALPGARLDGVTQIKDGYWKDTVWWDVGSISPELGRDLCTEAPFTTGPDGHYGPAVSPSPHDYNDALKRLGLRDYCAPAK
jgi:hypothetical protein